MIIVMTNYEVCYKYIFIIVMKLQEIEDCERKYCIVIIKSIHILINY